MVQVLLQFLTHHFMPYESKDQGTAWAKILGSPWWEKRSDIYDCLHQFIVALRPTTNLGPWKNATCITLISCTNSEYDIHIQQTIHLPLLRKPDWNRLISPESSFPTRRWGAGFTPSGWKCDKTRVLPLAAACLSSSQRLPSCFQTS